MNVPEQGPTVGPWAREKLDALGAYLGFYTTALKRHKAEAIWLKGTTFVDAFAGAGRAKLRRRAKGPAAESLLAELEAPPLDAAAEEYVRGSPRVALDLPNPFSRYVFIERDPARVAELDRLHQEYSTRSIEIRQGDAGDELEALLKSDLGRPGHRAVVFLDPFGMQISWATIERLAATRQVEVMINFTLGMAIHRVLPRSAKLLPGWPETLDRFFGTHAWHDQVYDERADLLGSVVEKRQDAGPRLLEWYRTRLNDVFGHVSPARLIKNTRGGHLYYLIWAGPHSLGLKGAHHILSKGVKVDRSNVG